MNKTELMNKATRSINRLGLKLKKHSPAICIAVGIGTGIAATISACKATTKLQDVLEYHEDQAKKFEKGLEAGKVVTKDAEGNAQVVEYTPEDAQKDMMINKVHTVLDVAKLYAPAVALGTISIVSTLAGYKILNDRYVSRSAALAAMTTRLKTYRDRVTERFGEELDRELMYGTKTIEVEETVKNEDGTEQTVKKTKEVAVNPILDEDSFLWYDGDKNFTGDPVIDRYTICQILDYCNQKCAEQGHLVAAVFRQQFNKPIRARDYEIGWIYDPKNPRKISAGIIERAYEGHRDARNFLDGERSELLITPNYDGYILDQI